MLRTPLILAATLALSACAMPGQTAAPAATPAPEAATPTPLPKPELGGLVPSSWVATQIAGQPVVGDTPPTLIFDETGRLSGNATCNSFNGPATVNGGTLALGPLVSTKMACSDAALNLQEIAYLAALTQAQSFAIGDDGVLTITSASGVGPILFRRQ